MMKRQPGKLRGIDFLFPAACQLKPMRYPCLKYDFGEVVGIGSFSEVEKVLPKVSNGFNGFAAKTRRAMLCEMQFASSRL